MPRKRNNPGGWRPYGPGKFDSLVDSFLFNEGAFDEETGESDGPGFYGLMVGDLIESAERGAAEAGDALNDDERAELGESKAVIFKENSVGFVWSEYFDTEKEARLAWKDVEAEVADFYGDEADEDE